jgi:hypothetical protein
MTSLTRLRDGDATDVERALLDSSLEDAPSASSRRQTLLALGLAAGAGGALAPTAAHAAVKIASGGKSAGTITALALAKWLGTGAAVGAVTAACIATATTPGLLFRKDPPPVTAPASTPTAPVARNAPAARPAEPESAEEAEPAPAASAPSHAAFPSGAPAAEEPFEAESAPVAARPAAPGTDVVAEVASLDRVRGALARGDANAAVALLADHARRFPGGALQPEAVVLRVRALRDLGRMREATALAESFLAAHPGSPQAPRLRALVGLASK